MVTDIGIIGTGLWQASPVGNDFFRMAETAPAAVMDPYRGHRDEHGVVRISGMEFHPDKHARTIAAIDRSFRDPFRGTQRRRFFPRELKVSDAETEAARHALEDAGLNPGQIDTVLVQSFLSDELQPKNAALVAHKLGIRHAPAWELESICNSALAHMHVGAALIMSGLAKHVLCVQSTAYSRVMDSSSSAAVQEGDMAAAFVLGPAIDTEMSFSWRTDGRLHGAIALRWAAPADSRPRHYWEPPRERLINQFDPDLQAEVMAEIADNARIVCGEALDRARMKMEEVDILIPHQPMSWFAAFLADILGLRDQVVFWTFEEYASINSASIPASIHHARLVGRLRRGTRLLLFGPAAGYRFGAVAVKWGGT